MNKKKKPKTWAEVYPMGSKEGNEEARFFKSLARNSKYTWRSTAALAKEAGITKERTEEIIAKYLKKGMIFQSSKNETMWAYWERVPEMLPDIETSISTQDKKSRIDKATGLGFAITPPAPVGSPQGATGAQGPIGVGPKGTKGPPGPMGMGPIGKPTKGKLIKRRLKGRTKATSVTTRFAKAATPKLVKDLSGTVISWAEWMRRQGKHAQ